MNGNKVWKDFTQSAQEKKIVCYGAGVNALLMLADRNFQPYLKKVNCFVDRDQRKHGKKLTADGVSYDIYPIEYLKKCSDYIVVVTLTDYPSVGKMLEEQGIEWFSWTMLSTEFIFDTLPVQRTDNQPAIFLLNTPDYINLGDQAIAYAEDIYLRKNFGNYYEFGTHSCHPAALNRLQEYIEPQDLILIQGGGNIGSLWRVCEEIFRDVLQRFPDNPIIVFPQSIYYGETNEEREYFIRSQEIYNSHRNLLICTRDKRSYDFVQKSYQCKCMLLPDMVLTIQSKNTETRKGIGVLLRSDKEQLLSDDYKKIIYNALELLGMEKRILTHHPVDSVSNRITKVKKILQEYAGCQLVVTDRLHGMIFSAITNTPCIAFDNSYHKVSGVYESWLEENELITVSGSLPQEELVELIKEKLALTKEPFDFRKYEEYFEPLTEYIKKLLKRGKKDYV